MLSKSKLSSSRASLRNPWSKFFLILFEVVSALNKFSLSLVEVPKEISSVFLLLFLILLSLLLLKLFWLSKIFKFSLILLLSLDIFSFLFLLEFILL